MFKAHAFCPGNKWCLLRNRHRWNAVSCTVVRLRVTAGFLPHLLDAVQFLEAMRNFVTVTYPSQRFYLTFAWSGFVGISIILIILANGISMWKNTILALASWIKEMLLRTSGSQKGSLVAWGISWYTNFTIHKSHSTSVMYQLMYNM